MTEELLQVSPLRLYRYDYYRLGQTNLVTLNQERIISKAVPIEWNLKKPDGLVVEPSSGVVKAYVEYKDKGRLRTQRQRAEAIDQEIEPARNLCNVLIVTDGELTLWINPFTGNEIKREGNEPLPRFNLAQILEGEVSQEELMGFEDLLDRIGLSITEQNDTIVLPGLLDPSQLAKTIWQKIWIQTGKVPEKCLYNVVELFIFKFLSDLGVLQHTYSFDAVFKIHNEGGLSADRRALDYYARLCRPEIHRLFPPGQDGTTIINGTIFVNEAGDANSSQASLFGEVLEELQDYTDLNGSFRYIQREFKTRLYETFLRQSAGVKFLGQFFTPRNVVRAMVEMSTAGQLPLGSRICDPFCGVGGFILEAIANTPHIYQEFEPRDGRINPEIELVGYDKGTDEQEDERTIILAKANMLIYFSELIGKYNSPEYLRVYSEDAFNKVFHLIRSNLGTFGHVSDAPYDLILTNPPYVTSGSSSLKRVIRSEGLSQHYTAGERGTEMLALEWVVRNLKPGGTALMVVPDGLLNQEAALAYLKRECIVKAIISLPVRTFYSTPKKTYILTFERKRRLENIQVTPVFAFLVSEIGETRDARRWSLAQNDLTDTVALYNQFKGSPTTFVPPEESRRCKVVSFDTLSLRKNWLIDRLWNNSELRELGGEPSLRIVTDRELEEGLRDLETTVSQIEPLEAHNEPAITYREVSLGDSELFQLSIGRRHEKRYMASEGVPVYSANVSDPFGYSLVDVSNRDFSFPALLWGIDGTFDWNYIPENQEFIPTDHCGVLRVTDEGLLPKYLYHALRSDRESYGFDRTYRASLRNVQENVTVRVPVDAEGHFDLEAQEWIATRYDQIQAMQVQLVTQLESLSEMRYEFQSTADIEPGTEQQFRSLPD